jgi:hypothetical protein
LCSELALHSVLPAACALLAPLRLLGVTCSTKSISDSCLLLLVSTYYRFGTISMIMALDTALVNVADLAGTSGTTGTVIH